MPERIYNEVIVPFLAVVENPTQRDDLFKLESLLIKENKMTEGERHVWPNNKLVALSSACYKFEYLYKLYTQFEHLITLPKQKDRASRCVMQYSYDCAPQQLYDQNLITQAKSTMSQSQFEREFGATFTDDSSGYFKTSKMALCTVSDGELPCVETQGDPSAELYFWHLTLRGHKLKVQNDFAIQILKLHPEEHKTTLVHGYALSGLPLNTI